VLYCSATVIGEWVHGLKEGKGCEVTTCGMHEGDWKANQKHGSGTERSLVGTVYEGRWFYNLKNSRGMRKMVHGEQQDQVSDQYITYNEHNSLHVSVYLCMH